MGKIGKPTIKKDQEVSKEGNDDLQSKDMMFEGGIDQKQDNPVLSDLEKHYDRNIRPLLDVVDKLRTLGIVDEGIQLPSIVVVGDQSSGKSSVLESLASISLPRGQGIATRVPLVLRLQRCTTPEQPSAITIEYGDVKEEITEVEIKSAVDRATIALAGDGKGVMDTPISLHIRKPNAPDLTMIDLPGITRVPVHGQPENIYEQIAAMIYRYIKPRECIILNVLSATVDFSTCESIRMSQKEDKDGERTLAVVTKVDRAPDGLFEKVTVDAVNIGLGYICVRNRTDEEESHKIAREKEKRLFETHPFLSKFDKTMVGIPALAEKLTVIQAKIIRSSLPGIVQKIESALFERRKELHALPAGVADEFQAEVAFMKIMQEKRGHLEQLVIHGNFSLYSEDPQMHYTARLDQFFRRFNDQLESSEANLESKDKTQEIIGLLVESRGVYLPNFLNNTLFQGLIQNQVDEISTICLGLVNTVYQYALQVVLRVIDESAAIYSGLKYSFRTSSEKVLGKTRDDCLAFVNRELGKERALVHTANGYYVDNVKDIEERIKSAQKNGDNPELSEESQERKPFLEPHDRKSKTYFGDEELAEELDESEAKKLSTDYKTALYMRICLMAYWKVVHKRLVDGITMELRYAFRQAIIDQLDDEVVKDKARRGIFSLVSEDESISTKRKRVQRSVQVLQESYAVVSDLLLT